MKLKYTKNLPKWTDRFTYKSYGLHWMGPSITIDPNSFGILQGKKTGVVCHFLLQGVFLIQGSKVGHLLHCRQTLYQLSHQGNPYIHTYIHTHIYLIIAIIVKFTYQWPKCLLRWSNNHDSSWHLNSALRCLLFILFLLEIVDKKV